MVCPCGSLTADEAHDNRLPRKLLSRLKFGSTLLADRGYAVSGSERLLRPNFFNKMRYSERLQKGASRRM